MPVDTVVEKHLARGASIDPLLSGCDGPETLPYQITLNCPIGADVRHRDCRGRLKLKAIEDDNTCAFTDTEDGSRQCSILF